MDRFPALRSALADTLAGRCGNCNAFVTGRIRSHEDQVTLKFPCLTTGSQHNKCSNSQNPTAPLSPTPSGLPFICPDFTFHSTHSSILPSSCMHPRWRVLRMIPLPAFPSWARASRKLWQPLATRQLAMTGPMKAHLRK